MNIDFVKVPFLNNPSMQKYEGQIVKKFPSDYYLEEKNVRLKILIQTYMENLNYLKNHRF